MSGEVKGGLIVQDHGNNVKAWGVAKEEDSGMIIHTLAAQESGAFVLRDYDILVRRDEEKTVAIYREH